MKFSAGTVAALIAAGGAWGAPTVSVTSVTQGEDRTVTVKYVLADEPAVITLDVETNGAAWASIGGMDVCYATGDVWERREPGEGTIRWRPDGGDVLPALAAGAARAVVKAWPVDDPPAYMAVDLTTPATRRITYYPGADFVPGGVLANRDWRQTKLLLRKIPAAGVTWWMGSSDSETGRQADETRHLVTLDANYYLAVFPLTVSQAQLVTGQAVANLTTFWANSPLRPVDKMSYHEARENTFNDNSANASYQYPNAPHPWSFLGRLRARADDKIAFDLPTEAQWEYACRAGAGDGYWGDGTPITAEPPGRYASNGGAAARTNSTWPPTFNGAATPEAGTAAVGSYAPNAWGLYDFHGNVTEWVLDWYAADISGLNGQVNADGANLADGTTAGANRIRRGGYFLSGAADCRAARRMATAPASKSNSWSGLRPCAPAVAP